MKTAKRHIVGCLYKKRESILLEEKGTLFNFFHYDKKIITPHGTIYIEDILERDKCCNKFNNLDQKVSEAAQQFPNIGL